MFFIDFWRGMLLGYVWSLLLFGTSFLIFMTHYFVGVKSVVFLGFVVSLVLLLFVLSLWLLFIGCFGVWIGLPWIVLSLDRFWLAFYFDWHPPIQSFPQLISVSSLSANHLSKHFTFRFPSSNHLSGLPFLLHFYSISMFLFHFSPSHTLNSNP